MTQNAAKHGQNGDKMFFDPFGIMQNHAHNACMAHPYNCARYTSFVSAQTWPDTTTAESQSQFDRQLCAKCGRY